MSVFPFISYIFLTPYFEGNSPPGLPTAPTRTDAISDPYYESCEHKENWRVEGVLLQDTVERMRVKNRPDEVIT